MKHFRSSLKDRTNKNSYSINHNVQASEGGGWGWAKAVTEHCRVSAQALVSGGGWNVSLATGWAEEC